jgi:hypothetical protein
MASTAICSAVFFAVQVPATIHNHQETLDGVWDKLSSPLAQFEIYSEMPDPINKHLYEKLEKFMIGFLRLSRTAPKGQNGKKTLVQYTTTVKPDTTKNWTALKKHHKIFATWKDPLYC